MVTKGKGKDDKIEAELNALVNTLEEDDSVKQKVLDETERWLHKALPLPLIHP